MKDYSELASCICEAIQENCGDATEAEELLRSKFEALENQIESQQRTIVNLSRWKVKAQVILLKSKEEIQDLLHSGGWDRADILAITNPVVQAIDSIVKRKHPKVVA